MLKDDLPQDAAAAKVREEVAQYKKTLDRNRTEYRIESEDTQPDGSVVIRIIKQYNAVPVGDYLN